MTCQPQFLSLETVLALHQSPARPYGKSLESVLEAELFYYCPEKCVMSTIGNQCDLSPAGDHQ